MPEWQGEWEGRRERRKQEAGNCKEAGSRNCKEAGGRVQGSGTATAK
jgi:hypothetical protein